MSEFFVYIFVFVIGACVGSFLNVVIYRIPNEISLLGSSRCPNCDQRIKPYHNVPVFGWIILGGKCAHCKSKFSLRYPLVEALSGVLFLIVYLQVGLTAFLPVALIFTSAMIALIFIDADHMILPNVITYPLFIFGLLVRIIYPMVFGHVFPDTTFLPLSSLQAQPAWLISLAGAIFGALIGAGSLWLVGAIWKALRGVEAMGLGDVKMMLGVGALLGWRLSLFTIFAGAFAGAIVGIAILSWRRERDFQMQIPFGIFLGAGAILALLAGDRMIIWYLKTFS